MRIGSLFSGIGGLELGLEWAGVGHVVWQVERDPFARSVLARHWPDADRSVEDVTIAGAANLAPVDLICGGFPCQDISTAGKGAGLAAGTRSGLWYEFRRIVAELRPAVVVVENVASGKARWLCEVRSDLRALGYDSTAYAVSAADVGAPESSSWATPRARDYKGPGFGDDLPAQALWPTPTASTYVSGQNGCPHDGRAQFAQKGKPSLHTLARSEALTWPTPTTQDSRASGVAGNWTPESGRNSGTTLTDAAVREGERSMGGRLLNPDWIEALMGFPPGWTRGPQLDLFGGPQDAASDSTHGSLPVPPCPAPTRPSG